MNKDIDQVFWPTWLAVSQLRDGSEVDDGAAFYRRACQWIDSAREALRDMGYSEHSVEHMLYTQCALLDESVLNRNRQRLYHLACDTFTGSLFQHHQCRGRTLGAYPYRTARARS